MIDLYYLNEQPFTDPVAVARRVKADLSIIQALLAEFFVFEDDCWHNKRADIEIAKYQYLKESGKKGAEKRWANKEEKLSQCHPISPPNATLIATKTKTNTITNNINTKTPEGVSDSVWKDFKKLREKHKAPITETAMKGLLREAKLANVTLEQVMILCCERGWRGFKAEWVKQEAQKAKELPLGTNEQIEQAYRLECGKDPALARFSTYFDMKNYIIKFREQKTAHG